MSQLQKFDPSKLMDGVRERIKATFVSLIPDDQWEALCKREADEFFAEKSRQDYHRTISDFQKICQEELVLASREKIKAFLADYDSQLWTDDGVKLSDKLGELLISKAPEIFTATFGNMFQSAVTNMKRY